MNRNIVTKLFILSLGAGVCFSCRQTPPCPMQLTAVAKGPTAMASAVVSKTDTTSTQTTTVTKTTTVTVSGQAQASTPPRAKKKAKRKPLPPASPVRGKCSYSLPKTF